MTAESLSPIDYRKLFEEQNFTTYLMQNLTDIN